MTERLIDGELCSLNMPALRLTDLIVKEDGSLLLLYADGMDRTLMNYTYSADTPTVPDKELRVFSLRDNKTIRQAMGLFQRQNPDVHVVYDVALTGADAVTASDALRTLANELLAGKGPDLLVLDGMPIDSYVEKGVLLDLSEPGRRQDRLGRMAEGRGGELQDRRRQDLRGTRAFLGAGHPGR